MENEWLTESIKRLPAISILLIASFFFFKFTKSEIPGSILLGVTITILLQSEHHEKIMNRQEKQIKQYSKQTLDVQKSATKNISDMQTFAVLGSRSKYVKESDDHTNTK